MSPLGQGCGTIFKLPVQEMTLDLSRACPIVLVNLDSTEIVFDFDRTVAATVNHLL